MKQTGLMADSLPTFFKRVRSKLGSSDQSDNNLHYVTGQAPGGSKIPNSVSLHQVESSLDGDQFRFGCTGCGKCCEGPGVIYFTADDLKNIQNELKLNEEEWRILRSRLVQREKNNLYLHQTDTACIFLTKDGLCSIYNVRPLQCRTYPFWTSVFESRASYQSFKEFCPGVDSDDAVEFDLQTIVTEVNKTEHQFSQLQHPKSKTLYL